MSEQQLLIRRRRLGDDNIIPMINIVFLLLIFFMIAGQIRAPLNSAIRLPETPLGKPAETVTLTVTLDREHRITLNEQPVEQQNLAAELEAQLHGDEAVVLLVDRQVSAAELDRVLGALRRLGVANLTLYSRSAE